MLRLLVAVLASCPGVPCDVALLQAKGLRGAKGPCGCGFGLIRRVQTRNELEKLSQPDLDAFKREVDAEKVSLTGEKDASAEKHEKELKEMKATSKELTDQMNSKTDESKATFKKDQASYVADAEAVKELETKVRELSDRQASAQADLSVVNGDLEFNLMNAQSCECDAVETVLIKHLHHKHKAPTNATARKSNSEVRKEKKQKAALLAAPDFKTIFAIEKTETEIVALLKDIQEGQSAYDAEVRAIQHARDAFQLNHTHVTSNGMKDADLLSKRHEAQGDAKKALEDMATAKEGMVEAAEARAKDAKAQLEELTAELKKCGCA